MYYVFLYIFLLKFHTLCSISYEPFEVKCSILISSWHSVVGMEMHYQDLPLIKDLFPHLLTGHSWGIKVWPFQLMVK